MEVNKVWGVVLIVVGVLAIGDGLFSIMELYDINKQVSSVNSMLGGFLGGAVMAEQQSYMVPILFLVGGVASCLFGTSLLKKRNDSLKEIN